MNKQELMREVDRLLDESKTAVLATVDTDNCPHMRWMSPIVMPGRSDSLYAITSPSFGKIAQLEANCKVEWMIQDRALTEVILLRGRVNLIDNPSLKSQIVERVALRLNVMWKVAEQKSDFVVLETVIESAQRMLPMKGQREDIPME